MTGDKTFQQNLGMWRADDGAQLSRQTRAGRVPKGVPAKPQSESPAEPRRLRNQGCASEGGWEGLDTGFAECIEAADPWIFSPSLYSLVNPLLLPGALRFNPEEA